MTRAQFTPPLGARLRADRVSRRFGETTAVDRVSLDLPPGSFTALVGPSGCGKSTLLSVLAGLLAPDAGRVHVDDRDVTGLPAERRPVALVFQKALLLPHLNVRDNVAFGLRMAGVKRRAARAAADRMLRRVDLPGLGGRTPAQLSGGQEQRVALARALVLVPRVLLLDEPFSQLDLPLREQMRALVRDLAEEAKVTTLFVTHDRDEALQLGATIAVMDRGRLLGHGTPAGLYTHPPSVVAARLLGETNELPGRVHAGAISVPGSRGSIRTGLPDGPGVLLIRPEHLTLHPATEAQHAPGPGFDTTGVVTLVRFAGTHLACQITAAGGRRLSAHVPLDTTVVPGETVTVTAAAARCVVLPPDGPADP